MATDAGIEVKPRWWRRWSGWVGYAAAAWSSVCGALGPWWALGGAGSRSGGTILGPTRWVRCSAPLSR